MQLSVVVVSHGHETMLPDCIASLAPALEGVASKIIVVDNLATGRVRSLVQPLYPAAIYLQNDEPVGFSENLNRAAKQAHGRFLLFLNPDTIHHSGRLADALDNLDAHREVGLLGCRLLNPDGSVQQNYRRFPTLPVILCRALVADRWPWKPSFYRSRMMLDAKIEVPTPVDWVFGAFMLVERSRFFEAGGMDSRFRLYYEDVDLCYRLRERCLRTLLYPDLRFVHRHMRSSASNPLGQAWRWHLCSALRMLTKHRYVFRPPVEPRLG